MSGSSPAQTAFDDTRATAFADRVAGLIDAGATAVMISIGHRLGLFDVLAELRPSTSHVIAARADLAERYVREWLAAMVVARIVDYEPGGRTYSLPEEHAASLTRDAALGNLAVYTQHVALLGAMQERVIGLFETGGGLHYADYPCFHAVMAEDSDQTVGQSLFEAILPLAPGLTNRLDAGIDVLDAGCGRGHALLAMAERYPASRFTGYDLGADAIEYARATARSRGLTNIGFAVRDLSDFDETARYDLITSFDAVHDQKDPADLVARLHRALRPDGIYLMQDVGGSARLENNYDFPMAALLYAISCAHCTPVSIAQGGKGLGTMWGWETAHETLVGAGFERIERNVLAHDPMNVWFVAQRTHGM